MKDTRLGACVWHSEAQVQGFVNVMSDSDELVVESFEDVPVTTGGNLTEVEAFDQLH